jgi:hypothetical protein
MYEKMKNPEVEKIFEDLDDYKRFCLVFGHTYNESALYNEKDKNYSTYIAFKSGTRISNNWIRDAKQLGCRIFASDKTYRKNDKYI